MAYAGRLFDRLTDHFGEEKIFMDIDTMKVGLDFVEQIEQAVQSCDVLIAVIGKTWLTIKDEEGSRRLDNPDDFVRVEIRAALEWDIPVIPLLVGGTGMPRATELPDAIAKLARRHAMKMSDERFRADATRLIEQITGYVTEASPESSREGKQTISVGMVLIPKGPFCMGRIGFERTFPMISGSTSIRSPMPRTKTSSWPMGMVRRANGQRRDGPGRRKTRSIGRNTGPMRNGIKRIILSSASVITRRRPMPNGRGNACPRSRSGKRRHGAPTAGCTPGERSLMMPGVCHRLRRSERERLQ